MGVTGRAAAGASNLATVVRYYEETWRDYSRIWSSHSDPALHFGYWDRNVADHPGSLMAMNRVIADAAAVQRGGMVLDAGCGAGAAAVWLARERGADVIGITPVQSQVRRASRLASEAGLAGRCRFLLGDYQRMSFRPATFDVVWAQESLPHATDERAFLREARRILVQGGRLAVTSYFLRPSASGQEQPIRSWTAGWAMPHVVGGDQFVDWTRLEGFEDVRLRDLTPNVRPSLERLHRLALRYYALGAVQHALRRRSDIEQGNLRGARHQWRALQRGLWFFGLLTATKGSGHG